MRRSDLKRRCIVDVSRVCDFIRTVTISGARVQVAYDNRASHELGEGGFYFDARFASVAAAVSHLETYLGRPFAAWTLYSSAFLPADLDDTTDPGSFWIALRENRIGLPDPDCFVLLNSESLRNRLPFPSRYRAPKARHTGRNPSRSAKTNRD